MLADHFIGADLVKILLRRTSNALFEIISGLIEGCSCFLACRPQMTVEMVTRAGRALFYGFASLKVSF